MTSEAALLSARPRYDACFTMVFIIAIHAQRLLKGVSVTNACSGMTRGRTVLLQIAGHSLAAIQHSGSNMRTGDASQMIHCPLPSLE